MSVLVNAVARVLAAREGSPDDVVHIPGAPPGNVAARWVLKRPPALLIVAELKDILGGGFVELLDERDRQVSVEGYGPEQDDGYLAGELASAAGAYAGYAAHLMSPDAVLGQASRKLWPWAGAMFKPDRVRRSLIKAGALILGELARRDRAGLDGPR